VENIEVEEYIRTKNGRIAKIDTINNVRYTYWTAKVKRKPELVGTYRILINGKYELEDIVKNSKNIIDLIEVGDYVNGLIVQDIIKTDKKHILYVNGDYTSGGIQKNEIKSIVTKEQFAQMEYKAGEEVNAKM